MEIKYRIIRSQRKTLTLTVDRRGELIVKAPKYLSDRQIEMFVMQNRDWIEKNVSQKEKYAEVFPVLKGEDGEKLYYLGYKISLCICDVKKTFLQDDILYVSKDKEIIPQIENWYKIQAKKLLPKLVEDYAAALGFEFSGVKITSAKTRFGSCSGKNNINFTYRLMMYDAECIKYVVVHELCHTVHKNHSAKYWELVSGIVPDYKRIREKMQKLSPMMDMI